MKKVLNWKQKLDKELEKLDGPGWESLIDLTDGGRIQGMEIGLFLKKLKDARVKMFKKKKTA